MINVLMTGAGAPGGPGIAKALAGIPDVTLHLADMDSMASGRFLHDSFFHIPPASDPAFIDTLAEICLQHHIDVLLPLVTRELFLLAEFRESFSHFGTRILVSDRQAMDRLNNKAQLYDALNINNLPCPEYHRSFTAEELLSQVSHFRQRGLACVIKPCVGNGSRGIRVIRDDIDRFDLLFNHKPSSLYMSANELELVVKGRDIPEMLVSEYLPGEEVTVDTMHRDGVLELILIRKRSKMSGGISVKGEFIIHEQIEQSVRDLCSSIPGLHGPIGFQLKQNSDGFYHFIECNPRIQGTSVAAAGLGINLPGLAVHMAMGTHFELTERRDGVAFIRYFEEVFHDL
jgi:carbamoyl-phosphate synthase large subunit